ncbi:hypothetical protein V6N11_061154 [Hibiscus sabdariffa]|uniref:Uncharacterized protein n=1 Tax=Hibiscus sabdariffa TaxID=183260 RepID=A0ABR2A0J5_9ROSI
MITAVLFALSSNPTFPRNLWEIGSESSCTPATFENRNNLSSLPNVVFSSAIAAVPRCLTAFDLRPKRLPFHQGPVPGDLGFEFGLLCVGSVGEHLSEVPAGEL